MYSYVGLQDLFGLIVSSASQVAKHGERSPKEFASGTCSNSEGRPSRVIRHPASFSL